MRIGAVMRWKALAAVLGVVLLVAIVFAIVGPRDVAAPAGTGVSALDSPTEAPSGGTPLAPTGVPSSNSSARPAVVPSAPARPPTVAAARPPPLPAAPMPPPPASEPGVTSPEQVNSAGADAGVPFALNKDGIKAAVQEKIPELRDCYDSWLQADPSLAGRIKVSFTIDTDPNTGLGAVTQIGVMDGGIDHLALQGCVMNVFKDLSFDAPENGPLTVNYPLRFSSGDAG